MSAALGHQEALLVRRYRQTLVAAAVLDRMRLVEEKGCILKVRIQAFKKKEDFNIFHTIVGAVFSLTHYGKSLESGYVLLRKENTKHTSDNNEGK